MAKYRKKPVVIEAVRWTGAAESAYEIGWFAEGEDWARALPNRRDGRIIIDTLEGPLHCNVGDWIIKGVKGEFYPIKDDIFRETYEAVDS